MLDEMWQVFFLGLVLTLIGISLMVLPLLGSMLSKDLRLPSIILYVYEGNGFTFVTSPILLIISILSIIIYLIQLST